MYYMYLHVWYLHIFHPLRILYGRFRKPLKDLWSCLKNWKRFTPAL